MGLETDTRPPHQRATTLCGLIVGQPDEALAIIDHDEARYTYGDLRRMVDEAAATLTKTGVRQGDRVLVVSENCALVGVLALAVNRLSAWIVLVNARHTAEEVEALANHAGARALIFTTEASAAAASHAQTWNATSRAAIPAGAIRVAGPFDTTQEPPGDSDAETVAALFYTTGTTSAPKGVMLTNANLLWNAKTSAELRSFTATDEVVGVLPTTHIFGFSSTFLSALYAACTIRFVPRFSAEAVLNAFEAGATAMTAVPNMYERILTHLQDTGRPFQAPRLRYISAGGAPLDPDWKEHTEAVFGLTLNNGYGLTETSPGVAATRPTFPRKDTSIGPALDGVEVKVDAPDDHGTGELLIKSPGLMKGYYRDAERTAEAITPDGWFHSGDLCQIAEDGAITIVGRTKELIVRSGFNVFPPEIEAMLTRDPAVLQAAVVGRKVKGNEDIIAFVLAPGADPAAIAARLREHLTPYKLPQRIILVDDFPTAPTGKILKHQLLDHFAGKLTATDAAS